jgi:hypothetical protein
MMIYGDFLQEQARRPKNTSNNILIMMWWHTTDFRSFETKDSVLEKTQRVFDVRKDSQFIEPRAKTNENLTSSETLSCFCCKLIQFDKLCDSFRKPKTLSLSLFEKTQRVSNDLKFVVLT